MEVAPVAKSMLVATMLASAGLTVQQPPPAGLLEVGDRDQEGESELASLAMRREILRNAVPKELAQRLWACCEVPADGATGSAWTGGVSVAWNAYVAAVAALDQAVGQAENAAGAADLDGRRRRLREEVEQAHRAPARGAEEAKKRRERLDRLRVDEQALDAQERALWTAHATAVSGHLQAARRLGEAWIAAASTPCERASAERAARRAAIGLAFPHIGDFEAAFVTDFGEVIDLTQVLQRCAMAEDPLGAGLRSMGAGGDTPWIAAGAKTELAEAARMVDEALIAIGDERLHDVAEEIRTGAPPPGLAPGSPELLRSQQRHFKQLARCYGAVDQAILLLREPLGAIDSTIAVELEARVRAAMAPRLHRHLWVEEGHRDGIDAWLAAREGSLDPAIAVSARMTLEDGRRRIASCRQRLYDANRERIASGAAGATSAMDGGEQIAGLRALRLELVQAVEQTLECVAGALEPSPAAEELRRAGTRGLEQELKSLRPRRPVRGERD